MQRVNQTKIADLVGCAANAFRHRMQSILKRDFHPRTIKSIRSAAQKSHALNGDKGVLLNEINDIEVATRLLDRNEVPDYLKVACRRSNRVTDVRAFRNRQVNKRRNNTRA